MLNVPLRSYLERKFWSAKCRCSWPVSQRQLPRKQRRLPVGGRASAVAKVVAAATQAVDVAVVVVVVVVQVVEAVA